MKTILIILTLISLSKADLWDYYPQGSMNHAAHTTVSMLLVVGANQILYRFGMEKENRILTSFVFGITAGLGKEIYDENTTGRFDPADMGFNLLGDCIGLGFIWRFGQ